MPQRTLERSETSVVLGRVVAILAYVVLTFLALIEAFPAIVPAAIALGAAYVIVARWDPHDHGAA